MHDQCQIIKFQPEKFNDYLADFLNQDFKNFKKFNIIKFN